MSNEEFSHPQVTPPTRYNVSRPEMSFIGQMIGLLLLFVLLPFAPLYFVIKAVDKVVNAE